MGTGGDDLQQAYTHVPKPSALSKPFSNIISSKKLDFLAVSGCLAQDLERRPVAGGRREEVGQG